MEKVHIIRLEKSEEGTFGVLRLGNRVFCVTLEPPDRDNQVGISCIPTGEYVCNQVKSPSFGPTFEVAGVPGRSHILFHQGNVAQDTRGCILLGRKYGQLDGARGVLQSRSAFMEFFGRMVGCQTFQIKVEERC